MKTQDEVVEQAYRAVIEDRIHQLWQYRHWYRMHPAWIPDSRDEDREELRNLVRLARKARALAAPPMPEPPPDMTYAKMTESELRLDWGDR